MPKKIGAMYIRVSTHMQDELSPDAQKRLLYEYAKQNDIIIPEEYIFIESVSGKKVKKRPEFLHMISIAKQKPASPFEIILVWKYSRFARNQEESIVYKSLLKKQCKVDVYSVSEPLVDGPFGSLIERIIEWMDEYYSIRLSGEVTRGMTEKAIRGSLLFNPPLGYKIIEKGKPPVIVEEEAEIIRLIFDKYVNDHMGIFELARYLNLRGCKTSRNKSFERRSVEYILQNPFYCGILRWNRTSNETKEVKDESEWIVTEGTQPAIISKELFQAAQNRQKSEYTPKGKRPSSTYKHWLSGIMKCPACGRTMTASHIKDKRYGYNYCYFTCYGYSKGKCMIKNSISSKKIEGEILKGLYATLQSEQLQFDIKQREISDNKKEERLFLQKQLEKLPAKESRIKEAYRNGIDTLEEYRENKEAIQKERETINKQLEALLPPKDNIINIESKMRKRILSVYDILKSDDFDNVKKNEALRSIAEKIVYKKEENTLEFFFYYS